MYARCRSRAGASKEGNRTSLACPMSHPSLIISVVTILLELLTFRIALAHWVRLDYIYVLLKAN